MQPFVGRFVFKDMNTTTYNVSAWIRIAIAFVCAHLVEIIGREESTLELLLRPFYYKDVLSGTVVAWILLESVHRMVKWLDSKYDWIHFTLKRLVMQLSMGVFACSLLAYLLVNLQFRFVLGQQMEDTTWFYYEFPFVVLLIILVNAGYVTYYFIDKATAAAVVVENHPNASDKPLEEENAMSREVLTVRHGNKVVPVQTVNIAYIFKEGEYNYVRSFENESYRIDASLEELESQLDHKSFFRANRQCIISLQSCKSFTPDSFGKLKVFLNPASLEFTVISQKRAPQFKKWIDR